MSPALAGGFLTTAPPGKSSSFIILKIYLFMAMLGFRFCARAFSSCGKRGPLFIAVRGPLTIVASIVAEHRLQTRRLSNCGSRAQLLRGMWDLPRPGLETVYPALAGRFSTTAPPGKPSLFKCNWFSLISTYLWSSRIVLSSFSDVQRLHLGAKHIGLNSHWDRRQGTIILDVHVWEKWLQCPQERYPRDAKLERLIIF